jgi:hypothetical protein
MSMGGKKKKHQMNFDLIIMAHHVNDFLLLLHLGVGFRTLLSVSFEFHFVQVMQFLL